MIFRDLKTPEINRLLNDCPPEDRYILERVVNADMSRYTDADEYLNNMKLADWAREQLTAHHATDKAIYLAMRGLAWRTQPLLEKGADDNRQLSLL